MIVVANGGSPETTGAMIKFRSRAIGVSGGLARKRSIVTFGMPTVPLPSPLRSRVTLPVIDPSGLVGCRLELGALLGGSEVLGGLETLGFCETLGVSLGERDTDGSVVTLG